MRNHTFRLLIGLAALAPISICHAERAEVVTFAATSAGYEHTGNASTPAAERETISIGEGKYNVGGPKDATLDAVPFDDVARRLSIELSRNGFAIARNPENAKFLVLVHRGRTNPRGDRDNSGAPMDTAGAGSVTPGGGLATVAGNAAVVGFTSGGGTEVVTTEGNLKLIAAGLGWSKRLAELQYSLGNVATDYQYDDMVSELSKDRYYISLEAYDMKAWLERGERVLAWEACLSFRANRKSFDDRYEDMIKAAAPHFGRNTPKDLATTWVDLEDS